MGAKLNDGHRFQKLESGDSTWCDAFEWLGKIEWMYENCGKGNMYEKLQFIPSFTDKETSSPMRELVFGQELVRLVQRSSLLSAKAATSYDSETNIWQIVGAWFSRYRRL